MSVDDTALEAIRKSAEEVTPGNKSEHYIKTSVIASVLPDGAATESTLAAVLAAVDGLEGFTDGLEALIGATNSLLTTIRDNADQLEGYTDGLEGLIGTLITATDQLEGFVDQLEGYLDDVEANQSTGNASLASIDGKMSPASSAVTSVPGSASSVTLLASNAARKGLRLYNDSTQACFVCYGATASSSTFTRRLPSQEFHNEERYTGIVTGIWNVAVGNMRITELT